MTSGTSQVPDVALFSVGGRTLDAARLAELAAADGRWSRVVGRAARGCAAIASGVEVPADAARAAERSFRYARGLVAAEDVEAWLGQYTLTVAEWRDHVRREVALDRVPDVEPTEASPREVWVTACCSGLLPAIAEEQARRAAAAAALGLDEDAPGPEVVASFLAAAVDDAQIDRELRDNTMGWLRIAYTVLTAPNEDAAAEARLCLTEDGMSTEEVGRLLDSPVLSHDTWLGECPDDLVDLLLTTPIGGTAVPVPRDIGVDVIVVSERRQLPDDAPELRAAVRDVLAERALVRQVEDRVRWHVRL